MLNDDPLWYKDAIIYELRVGAFFDSTGSGIGDFAGLTQKLDYLQDLGVTALWLLPFYPSPFRDDGYDISDYTNIHPAYGTIHEFRTFLKEAHDRGLRVITELVLNHTSDQNPWFQRARRSPPGSSHRNFYVWADNPSGFKDTRIIFKDFETTNWHWDPVAQAYYWHRFYSHQPDLNFDSPDVRRAIMKVIDFWLELGVDGLRLDAVPYLIEREGTNCENLPETHAVLKDLRRHVDKKFKNRMLLAEANQWPEDAAAYFGEGDECQMAFHFPIMPRLFMASYMEDRFPLVDILEQTPVIPDPCQWALFLRNHDELTLEMVTDEEREYMYRIFANDPQARINLGIRRRLAPLLGNNRKKIELMNGLLFSLPGTPVLYYGDEIGMGDNIYLGDRNSVRTPMQWSADRNAGFSRANSQKLYLPVVTDPEHHYEALNVEAQQNNLHSMLWWMKRFIALRKRYKSFGRGTMEVLKPDNRKVLAFIRRTPDETILVVANLSRYAQYVELDLSAYKGMKPVELFGQVGFPLIGDLPYLLTLGPHTFFWFLLEPQTAEQAVASGVFSPPLISLSDPWEALVHGDSRNHLEAALPAYMKDRRWFGGKSRKMRRAKITESIALPLRREKSFLLFVQVDYVEGSPETYLIPVSFASGEMAAVLIAQNPDSIVASVKARGENGVLFEALADKEFCSELFNSLARRRTLRGTSGDLTAVSNVGLRLYAKAGEAALPPAVGKIDQSNTSIIYGDKFILKLYRRLYPGRNPDLEIGLHLTGKIHFSHTPATQGFLEFRRGQDEPLTVGLLQDFVPNQGNAWDYTVDHVEKFIEAMLAGGASSPEGAVIPDQTTHEMAALDTPEDVRQWIGPSLESFRLIGQRTGELHLGLATQTEDPAFSEEPFGSLYQRSLYQSMRNLTNEVFLSLKKRLKELPASVKPLAEQAMSMESKVLSFFHTLVKLKTTATRVRAHGDYHLGQLLFTGKDFVIIDFEGEPARSMGERKLKRSPLRDVAGMIRSFHYAAHSAVTNQVARGLVTEEKLAGAEKWAEFWTFWTTAAFLKSYFNTTQQASFIPKSLSETATLLDIFLLEKAVYELWYELNNRPNWIKIPIDGITRFMQRLGSHASKES